MRLGNGLWEAAEFNTRLQVTELALGHGVASGDVWKLGYEYGELNADGTVNTAKNTGNIAKQMLSFNGLTQPFVTGYRYDSLYRLTEAKETQNSVQTWKQNLTYDRYGNRLTHDKFIGTNQVTQTNITHPTIDANTNRFNANQGYLFDKNGNLTTDAQNRSFVFNGDNKQKEVRDESNNLVGEYFYDGEGKRVKKVTDLETTVFVYSSGKLIAEYSTATPPQNPTTSWTVTDQLGSPRVLVNSLGEVVSRRDFMPFGEELSPDGNHRTANQKYGSNNSVRQKFTGYQKDDETGLDFAEARMYENRHARFTAVDPLLASGKSASPQTFNRYVYVLNNPLVFTYPAGLQVATIEEDPIPVSVETYWNRALNTMGTFRDYLNSLGGRLVINTSRIEQGVRFYAYTSGGEENYGIRTSTYGPVTRQFGGILNPTTEPSITTFNNNMENFNQQVIQRTPLLSSLVNAQIAGRNNDYVGFTANMGMFGVDLGTTVFSGGTTGTLRRGGQEVFESAGKEGFNLALGLGDNLFDFAKRTNSTTYFERAGTTGWIPETFERMAFKANEINFNLRNFSFSRHSEWIKQDKPFVLGTATSYELDFVLSNKELLNKTKFFVYPSIP